MTELDLGEEDIYDTYRVLCCANLQRESTNVFLKLHLDKTPNICEGLIRT